MSSLRIVRRILKKPFTYCNKCLQIFPTYITHHRSGTNSMIHQDKDSNSKERRREKNIVLVICGWVAFYFTYIFFGGYILTNLEQQNNMKEKIKRKNRFLATLAKYNYSANNTAILEIITHAIEAYNYDALDLDDLGEKVRSSWDLSSGIFFANSIITTIGYGNIYPRTGSGRAFCIIYGTFGIAMTGIILMKIGRLLENLIQKSDSLCAMIIPQYIRDDYKSKVAIRVTQLVITTILMFLLIWILPAYILMRMEDWTFITATYFCFISLTTIGLGDVVPGSSHMGGPPTTKEALYEYASILYILIGLAALSTILNMVGSLVKTISEVAVMQAEDYYGYASKIIMDMNNLNMSYETPGSRSGNLRVRKLYMSSMQKTITKQPTVYDPPNGSDLERIYGESDHERV